jgi:hypothetical protein
MTPSLDNARAKLERAYEHLESLDREIPAFFATRPYEISRHFDENSQEHVFRLDIRRSPPPRLGTILGDFVQNTRAALDHLLWQLVLLNGKRPNASVRFPIYSTAADEARDASKRLGRVRPDHRARIEAVQPHNAGEQANHHVLSILAWLSNTDKHRVLHATYGYVPPPPWDALAFAFRTSTGIAVPALIEHVKIANGRRMTQGAEIVRVRLRPPAPDLEVQMHAEFIFDIAFGDRWFNATKLERLHEWVRQFVEWFANDFP